MPEGSGVKTVSEENTAHVQMSVCTKHRTKGVLYVNKKQNISTK